MEKKFHNNFESQERFCYMYKNDKFSSFTLNLTVSSDFYNIFIYQCHLEKYITECTLL